MTEQLSLPGPYEPQRTDRLFFAIFPDERTAAGVARTARHLRSEHALNGKPLATERFHSTLHHLGDHAGLPQQLVAMAKEAASTVAVPPFEIAFDRAMSFARRRGKSPFVLLGGDGLSALISFQQKLGMAMANFGLGRFVNAQYTPHMTLLYDDRCVPERVVETVTWTAREFVLVHSLVGQTKHVHLARWTLRDSAGELAE